MPAISNTYNGFSSALSLQPLVMILKKMITEGKPGARNLYQSLISEVEAVPELMKPIEDRSLIQEHEVLIETLLSTIFPPSTNASQGIYAISLPFTPETIYASPGFKELFMPGENIIRIPEQKDSPGIDKAYLSLAHNLILQKFYSLAVPVTATSVHPLVDADSGLTRYYELRLNAQFVDVKCIDKGYALPSGFSPNRVIETDELKELFPLEHFHFEGIIAIDVTEVTQEQVIMEIKNSLLNINAFSDVEVYDELQFHVQSLIGLKNVRIGITPFFKKNDYYLYTEAHYRNSILFSNKQVFSNNRDRISEQCKDAFRQSNQCLLYEILNESSSRFNGLLKYYYDQGIKSLILCPLKCEDGELIGLLEIAGETKGRLQFHHLTRLQPAIQLFALALEKTSENLQMQIDKTIKEHFTAIQPAVEWKFTEAAFHYLQHQQSNEMVRMPAISFEDVYPLYGSIDIRNSSTERSLSIQEDLLEQLNMASEVISKADRIMEFPLLKEVQFRIEKFILSVTDTLLSDDEMMIYDYLQNDLDGLFKTLKATKPELRKTIDHYYNVLDPQRKVVYNKRKNYEESITRINDVLDRFMDVEQRTAQEAFPHYFERYITDGIEFNIYIGQSISPKLPFNEMYVRNLKLWQLTLLAKAARISESLQKRLTLPLQTTQLILAHPIPLTISFRRKERKFDVDGAYNIRYEIVKKRIDKVHLKDSEERLTQPGKVAIVYSQQKELNEYLDYISFLQKDGLLNDQVEHLELEDTQGISGLKAIRVDVNLEPEAEAAPRAATAKAGTNKVFRK